MTRGPSTSTVEPYGVRVQDAVEPARARALAVARRAVDLAAAGGVGLPADLRIWALAGERPAPSSDVALGRPEDLGVALEAGHTWPERRQGGIHYTPEPIATELVARAMAGRVGPSVGDPACGGGALLLAAARRLGDDGMARPDVLHRLWGADIDPVAVATAEAALTLWAGSPPARGHLVVADSLLDAPWPAPDVVVGNPPFATPLSATRTRSPGRVHALRSSLGPSVAAYTDDAALHLLAAARLTRPGGSLAVLVPRSLLGARDAASVRRSVEELGRVREVWVPSHRFDAAVDVCAIVVDRAASPTEPAAGSETWSFHLARTQGVPEVAMPEGATVQEVAEVVAGFRQEYYELLPHLAEAVERPEGRPAVTTGLVDLGEVRWGRAPARVGGRRWEAPVVDGPVLGGRGATWAARTGVPKALVAGQSRIIETAVDATGSLLPVVPLVAVLAPLERLWPLAAALAAPPVVAWAAAEVAGTGRSPHALRVGAPLLRRVPLPPDDDAWHAGAAALAAGDLARFALAMTEAYGCDPSVARWWCDQAKVACSTAPVLR